MSAQIEARRLSGEHLGKEVAVDGEVGELEYIAHDDVALAGNHRVDVELPVDGRLHRWSLAPTDLVTIHDDRTTTPTPKETP